LGRILSYIARHGTLYAKPVPLMVFFATSSVVVVDLLGACDGEAQATASRLGWGFPFERCRDGSAVRQVLFPTRAIAGFFASGEIDG
jgi:hypothetical protein